MGHSLGFGAGVWACISEWVVLGWVYMSMHMNVMTLRGRGVHLSSEFVDLRGCISESV